MFETVKTTITGDHPRVGGEKVTHNTDRKNKAGSPPRGRGKGAAGPLCRVGRGITPAWAGKRAIYPYERQGGGDHPRVGGEKHLGS